MNIQSLMNLNRQIPQKICVQTSFGVMTSGVMLNGMTDGVPLDGMKAGTKRMTVRRAHFLFEVLILVP